MSNRISGRDGFRMGSGTFYSERHITGMGTWPVPKKATYMESAVAMNTVFGIVVTIPNFELSYPVAVAFVVLCLGAWILTIIDIRRKNLDNLPTQEEIDREFERLVRRR